ncbi:hypothetical protein LH612_36685, partial [Klebsiella pneumoniae]|nr:hypothetical protein [Klebsiella pneumoniae]
PTGSQAAASGSVRVALEGDSSVNSSPDSGGDGELATALRLPQLQNRCGGRVSRSQEDHPMK